MKKLINLTWILFFLSPLFLACTEDPEKPIISDEADLTQVEGNWIVTNAVYNQEDNFLDVTEFFIDFKMKINKDESLCCINGREIWTAEKEWVCNGDYFCNLFKIADTDYVIFFDIRSIRGTDSKIMLANIFMGYPGLSFLPEDKNRGDYRIMLTTE